MITNRQLTAIKQAVRVLRGNSNFGSAIELENSFGLVWIDCRYSEPPQKGVYCVTYKGGKKGYELYKGDAWISIEEVIKWKRMDHA